MGLVLSDTRGVSGWVNRGIGVLVPDRGEKTSRIGNRGTGVLLPDRGGPILLVGKAEMLFISRGVVGWKRCHRALLPSLSRAYYNGDVHINYNDVMMFT